MSGVMIDRLLFWRKEPTVEFICTIPAAMHMFPIKPARQYLPDWVKAEAKKFAAELKKTKGKEALRSVARCPGIRKAFSTGWVACLYQDIRLTVHADGSWECHFPIDQTILLPNKTNLVSDHDMNSFSSSEFLSKKRPILKINLPWLARVPKGYLLYQKPMPYQEHDMFMAGEGVFERAYGVQELNVQLLWNNPGTYLLPAGMPLAHYILVRETEAACVVRHATQQDMDDYREDSLIKNSKFVINFTEVREHIAARYAKKKNKALSSETISM